MLARMKGGRILVATDGSPASQTAVDGGLEIAAGRAGRVTFLHADTGLARRLLTENAEEPAGRAELIAEDAVLREAVARAEERGVAADVELIGEHGADDIASALVGVAGAIDADMIVVGSRGRGAIKEFVLGSVSHSVLQQSTVPVLVTHAQAEDRSRS
jgi:nucleotide-binding universal stress UspA family protein